MTVAGLVEHSPEGKGRDPRQAVGRRSHGLAQGNQRPGRRPVDLRGRGPLDLAEDSLPRRLIVRGRMSAAMARCEGRQALGVEPSDQVRDGVARASARGTGGRLRVVTTGDGQEHDGPCDLSGGSGLRPAQLGQGHALRLGERAKGILLAARHRWPPCVERPSILRSRRGLWLRARQMTH
jgi:hypothetical protein